VHLCLIAGISGLAKRDIARKLVGRLKRSRGKGSPKVGEPGDVERELLRLIPRDSPVRGGPKDLLAGFIGQHPPEEVRDKWKQAYARAVQKATARKPDIAVVCACLEYYRFETYEYFSPFDRDAISATHPSQILTLIDDVFDIYYRLSRAGEVFDIRELMSRKTDRRRSQAGDQGLRALYKDALGTVVESLLRILVWREKEIAAAANLALSADIGHAVLGAKHPVDTGVRLLLGGAASKFGYGETCAVYVSHPISRPRRARQRDGCWPPIVPGMDSVLDTLAKADIGGIRVVPVRPTAIDEFRLLDDGTYLQPYLTPRWPFCEKRSMYCLPKLLRGEREFADYPDFERRGLTTIFDPPLAAAGRGIGFPLPDPEVSGILRALNESIRLQMAGRDHLLVRKCPGMFLFRPVYDEGKFSSGVDAEIITFENTRRYEQRVDGKPPRRIAFIHDVEDANAYFGAEGPDGHDYRTPVHEVAGAVEARARALAASARAGLKTRSPARVSEEAVAQAARTYADPEDGVRALYAQLFPLRDAAAIGTMEALSWEATRESLTEALVRARAASLGGDVGGEFEYVYAEDAPLYRFPQAGTARFGNCVEVVKGLDEHPARRKAAAERAARFFACGTSRPLS